MRLLNGLQAAKPAPSHLPLTPAQAKRLTGVLRACAALGVPTVYAGYRIASVERKRHPYDVWTTIQQQSEVDSQAQTLKYRAVVQLAPTGTAPVNQDLV